MSGTGPSRNIPLPPPSAGYTHHHPPRSCSLASYLGWVHEPAAILRDRGTMMGATADHIVSASTDAGIDVGLPSAVKAQYDRASPLVTAPTAGRA